MDRRQLLKGLCGLLAVAGLGGYALPGISAVRSGPVLSDKLRHQLAELADPRFGEYARTLELETLADALAAKGIISPEYGVDYERLRLVANQETMTVYLGFYYTPTELQLYSLAYLAGGV
ncbi:hypothetical protein [Marinobacter fonticola]|uniref:hypothetical protein n=1 Tax=Marinobacter fonticola TaxID=2603215 RepID=UPI0011E7064D|nr:hypothetical protein [Marinobacter fonticola]